MEGPTGHKKSKKLRVESDDEEEEEDDEEEVKDLIDDNPIEEDDSGDESDGSRKRKKSDDDDDEFDDRLEDDDYDLLEENLGVKVKRKFKRLKTIQDNDSEDEETMEKGDDREAIANQLFEGSDNEEPNERQLHRDEVTDQYRSDDSEESEADDFIVDDDGQPITDKRKKRKPIFTDATLQEAQDIFGVDFDYEEFDKFEDEEYDEADEDEDEDEAEYETEEQRSIRRAKKVQRKKRKPKALYEIYEPSELERAGFTDEDTKIRAQDVPERMQLRSVPVCSAEADELDEEAEWIYKIIYGETQEKEEKPSLLEIKQDFKAPEEESWDIESVAQIPKTNVISDSWDSSIKKVVKKDQPESDPKPIEDPKEVKPKEMLMIRKALEFMRNQNLEVPFISFYRKEYVTPATNDEEEKKRQLKLDRLWQVYRLDGKFCQLRIRKNRLYTLFVNMQKFQNIKYPPPEDILQPDDVKRIKDEDLERIKQLKSSEELKDFYLLFQLYYADDVPVMKEYQERVKREEKAKAREKARIEREENEEEGGKEEEPIEEEDGDEEMMPTMKRKIGGGTYGLCKKLEIEPFIKEFGLSAEKFAENLSLNYSCHEIDPDKEARLPLDVAEKYTNFRVPTADDVIKAAKFMLATQISREPLVRQTVRDLFFENATISVQPTKKGMKEIDESSPIYSLKYLKDKPIKQLVNDQFLKLSIAEEDKLITITIGEKIIGQRLVNLIDEAKKLFNLDKFAKEHVAWNTLRAECLDFVFEKLLYPVLRKELRAKLLQGAKEYVLNECAKKLQNWIKVKPYEASFEVEDDDDDWDITKGIKVLAIAYSPDITEASFACFLAPDGEPSDYLRLQNIIKQKNSYFEDARKEKLADLAALRDFIFQKKPHVVVVGGESRDAIMIKQDVFDILLELKNDEGFPDIKVEIIDNQLAKVYANSIKAAADFREYPLLLKQAISLGRRLQDPLIEFSQLCTPDDEILCLRFHPLQDHVPKEELLDYLQLEFVNRTNEVGVDVNRAINYPYTQNLVQFVCGLGLRKATALIKTLKQNNQRLENRTQLITVCHMGPKIFINCSGFIKIDTNSLGDSTEAYVEVLDGSRVHPETYEWARKMAVDALEYDDDDANPAGALEEILESPERLKDLDLDAFAEELERQGFGNKNITLYDIRSELNDRYKDMRISFTVPTPEELFNMLTKETPETFYIGKLITANVVAISHKKPQDEQLDKATPVRNEITRMWQCAFCKRADFPDLSEIWNHFDAGGCPGEATGVRIRLDSGVSGFIPISKLSDNVVTNPEDRVRKGQTIHCRITKIDVIKFSVDCTSKTSDLVDKMGDWKPHKDVCYDDEAENRDMKKDLDLRKLKDRQQYIKRVIVHPSFKNISFRESEKMMETMDQGEVIVRPSSKGADHLTVTWKVAENIYQHIDVREEGKENAFSLGQSLWIQNEEFEDLDEIIARYVNPMAAHARDILNFKYYNGRDGGTKDRATDYLMAEKMKNSNKIHYIMYASKEFPGKFVLSYLPRHKAIHEFITINPEGFRFRQQNFDSLNQLFKWFKEHYRDAPPVNPVPTATPRTHVPRTPYATPGYAPSEAVISRVEGSAFTGATGVTHTTPHYPATTPAQAFTPFSAYTSHTPYTPTAQTPFMTPYQTPFQQTPRMGTNPPPPTSTAGFLHPGAVTPGHKTPQEQRFPKAQSVAGGGNDALDWRRAAEAWARSQQKGHGSNWNPQAGPKPPASTTTSRFGPAVDRSQGNKPNFAPKSPAARNAAQVISEGIQRTQQMSSAHNFISHGKSPRTGRDSLKSTPRTNFSPRSMVESSLGDETPLYDEN